MNKVGNNQNLLFYNDLATDLKKKMDNKYDITLNAFKIANVKDGLVINRKLLFGIIYF